MEKVHCFRVSGPSVDLINIQLRNRELQAFNARNGDYMVFIPLSEDFFGRGYFYTPSDNETKFRNYGHTIDSGVVRLNKGLFYFPVLDDQSIAFTALVSEDGGAVES
jgi:hypothetical protein